MLKNSPATIPLTEAPTLPIAERNKLVTKHYHAIVSKPVFKPGQKVVASLLAVDAKIFDEGQAMIVTRFGPDVAEEAGDKNYTAEVSFFNAEAHLIRTAIDPRFIKSEKGENVNE